VRLLHTADWHLGRIFYGASLLEDQAVALDGFCALAADLRPDAIVIAGDVYDRSVPPPEAVTLLDDTLTRLLMETGVPVVLVAGNHDNAARLAFGRRMLAERGLHIAGLVESRCASVELATPSGPVRIWALPHADPPEVACALCDDEARGHEAAMAARLAEVRQRAVLGVSAGKGAEATPADSAATEPRQLRFETAAGSPVRHIVVAHAFVAGGRESESERPLSVGGTGQVSAELFRGFDYVALGHLHRPQSVSRPGIRYAGSLLKYSFDEHDHRKSVTLVEIGADGGISVEEHELPRRRDVRKISGYLEDLLRGGPAPGAAAAAGGGAGRSATTTAPAATGLPGRAAGAEPAGAAPLARDDYLWVDLLDELPVPSPLERLRSVYPNVRYAARVKAAVIPGSGPGPGPIRAMGLTELFERFFADTNEAPLTAEAQAALRDLVEEFEQKRRSA